MPSTRAGRGVASRPFSRCQSCERAAEQGQLALEGSRAHSLRLSNAICWPMSSRS